MSPATIKRTEAFMQSDRYFCPIVTKSEISLHIFIKVLNIKFHRNSFSAALTHVDEHPADMMKLTGAFRNYANALKNG
jgi:hypothetical protein